MRLFIFGWAYLYGLVRGYVRFMEPPTDCRGRARGMYKLLIGVSIIFD